jgi:hypothetical protein
VNVVFADERGALLNADCLEALRRLSAGSVDAVVTDPPYELGFMGKRWDAQGIAFSVDLWREVLRVLKPGGHLLAFGGTRTYHRMTCAIEDAGFEIRDSLHWMYGTGFPKSLNVGDGRGTALKPGHEPIVLARKPLEGTVAENVAAYGTGALNIDGCRLLSADSSTTGRQNSGAKGNGGVFGASATYDSEASPHGRWPANVLLDEHAAAEELEAQAPGASRFFYVAKPSRAERDRGCEHLQARLAVETVNRDPDSAGVQNPRAGAGRGAGVPIFRCALCELNLGGGRAATACPKSDDGKHVREQVGVGTPAKNYHPTVKPIELMRYLVRLVTPPGGVVLDPFTGSGTTGIAALLEGARFVGIEREPEYAEIAKARIGSVERAA